MPERQPDEKLIRWLDFPAPPYRIADSRSRTRLIAGWIAVILLAAMGAAILIAYFGFSREGQTLLVDTGLAVGIGAPLTDATVTIGECDPYHTTGKYGSSGWDCPITVSRPDGTAALSVDLNQPEQAERHRGAGSILGAVGLYWPAGLILQRWLSTGLLVVAGGGLLWIASFVGRIGSGATQRSRLRNGQVRSADLLTWSGVPWFSFVDDAGTRRFQRATEAGMPLVLDGVASNGVALVAGRNAALLRADLAPLQLDAATRQAILERAAETHRQCLVRHTLPAQPGDPPTFEGRIAKIEAALKAKPDVDALTRLYNDAWRLVWDSNDGAIAHRALVARDAIVGKLGPQRSWAALEASRKQFVK